MPMPSARRVSSRTWIDTPAVPYRDVRRLAALAKVVSGWHRQAAPRRREAGSGGLDHDRLRREPSGVDLVDVPSGTTRRLEARASYALVASGRLLVAGDQGGGAGPDRDGPRRLHARRPEAVACARWRAGLVVQSTGGYAYVAGEKAYPPTVRVIDLADGGVRTLRGQPSSSPASSGESLDPPRS